MLGNGYTPLRIGFRGDGFDGGIECERNFGAFKLGANQRLKTDRIVTTLLDFKHFLNHAFFKM